MALLPQKGDTGFTLGGFLILAALGTFLWKGAPLESVRPSSEEGGWYEQQLAQQVPARLWQDPFKAVYIHEQAIKAGTASVSYEKHPREALQAQNSKTHVNLLMIMVSPGSYAELEERRRRRRYAVLSGLGEEHFVPRDPEMLNVFYHPASCFPGNRIDKQNNSTKDCFAVPYEWYEYEDPSGETLQQRQVLVLWLNESQFVDSPLQSISTFLEELLPQPKKDESTLHAILLGPARSDALRNLVTKDETEAYEWLRCHSYLADFNILSSTATVADSDLLGIKFDKTRQYWAAGTPLAKLQQKIESVACEDQGQGNAATTRIRFLRTIQSDEMLIGQLVKELKDNRAVSAQKDYVVVISEWDTYFGRSLPRAFIRHFCADDCGKNNYNIVKYSYQRGMDGIIAGKQQTATRSQANKQTKVNGLSSSIDVTTIRRPVGSGQFDYLRRLAADIQKKDQQWRMGSGHGVRVVVLLGSDVYDKLLILRALRPQLPGALFATTDLDAQLLHPAEYSWARSLIIASTYNLGLSADVPMPLTTMPFRDSYQTSVYLATRLAFNAELMKGIDQQGMYEKIPPQLFEVGRQSLVQLSTEKSSKQTWNQVPSKSFSLPLGVGLIAMAVLAIFALHQLRPKAGRILGVASFLLLAFTLLGIGILKQGPGGEPIAIIAGASIWPTEYIRLLSVVLAFVFIWTVVHRLNRNWHELGSRYFWGGSETHDDGITISQLFRDLAEKFSNPVQIVKRTRLVHLLPVVMLVIMFLVMRFILPAPRALSDNIWLAILVWTGLIVLWWATIYGKIWKRIRVMSINKWGSVCKSRTAVRIWRTYGVYGAPHHRFLRTIAYVLIYFAFASILFAILGPPTSPCRGTWACAIDGVILGVSVLSMLVLFFLVFDEARLCICWVDSMREPFLNWENTRKSEFTESLRLPDVHAIAWIKVHMIGERTSEVTRLIYYPVFIILLMLLARSTFFDNWDFPQALGIVVGLNFVIALSCVVRLNFVAQTVRGEILHQLQNEELAGDRREKETYVPSPPERKELIYQLEHLRIGAYLPLLDQPPVRATLMLLGGVALTYAEYLGVFLR